MEDQRPFLLLLRGLVNSLGATEVGISHSADQALSMSKKTKYDIVICDLHLGADKKNGFELIEELRLKKYVKPNTVFLMISADSARPVVLGSLERDPDDYIVKPFSQAQLKRRINKAWQRRQYMLDVYDALLKDDQDLAIELLQTLCAEDTPYKRYCTQLLIEIYLSKNELDLALALLENDERAMPALWTKLALAKTKLLLGDFTAAKTTAMAILETNSFCAEAYDILAESENSLENAESSLKAIKRSLKISPYSLTRQHIACRIARENQDWDLYTDSSMQIWQLSKRTVHQNIQHWCNYVSSYLDAAEACEDKKQKNRYQQEALLLIHRCRFDDVVNRLSFKFDIDVFENIVNSRVSFLDGKLLESKKNLLQSQNIIEQRYEECPAGFVPETLKVLFDLGEFEEASQLIKQVEQKKASLEISSQYLIESVSSAAKNQQINYSKHNTAGIGLYQEGKFKQAKEEFTMAQQFAPMNTGIALNLIQCILKLLSINKKTDPKLVTECKRIYRNVAGLPLKQHHLSKLESLENDLAKYLK